MSEDCWEARMSARAKARAEAQRAAERAQAEAELRECPEHDACAVVFDGDWSTGRCLSCGRVVK